MGPTQNPLTSENMNRPTKFMIEAELPLNRGKKRPEASCLGRDVIFR